VKVLLDVCTPVQVREALLPAHEVYTAAKLGWGAFENGDLLRAAEAAGFDLLIICDKNLRHQQNLQPLQRLAILELWTNHRPALEQHWALIRQNAETMQVGEYRSLSAP
jgi:hypothetical protein